MQQRRLQKKKTSVKYNNEGGDQHLCSDGGHKMGIEKRA